MVAGQPAGFGRSVGAKKMTTMIGSVACYCTALISRYQGPSARSPSAGRVRSVTVCGGNAIGEDRAQQDTMRRRCVCVTPPPPPPDRNNNSKNITPLSVEHFLLGFFFFF